MPRTQRSTMRRTLARLLLAGAVVLLAGASSPAHAGMLAPGDPFPEWILRDQDRRPVRSDKLAGKTYLLWFYPKAMTPGCTTEGNALRDSFAVFAENGVEIFGVSFDSPEENGRFVRAQDFPFRLLSDDGTLAVKVGAADARDQAMARRISYLVGPDGKVLRAYANVNPATHAQQVLGDVTASTAKAPEPAAP